MNKWCCCSFWWRLVVVAMVLNGGLAMASITTTKHNLSNDQAGTYRASAEKRICLMCHTPHSGDPAVPLWNHTLSAATYTPYSSTTLNAAPGQPTGSSKLCLSCHDGTVAVGSVVNMPGAFGTAPEVYSGIIGGLEETLELSPTNLDTDLRDDHPISFLYDNALALITGELKNPLMIPGPIKLDAAGELQCTSCHEPHSALYPMFLRVDFVDGAKFGSQLCLACHEKDGWAYGGTNKHRDSEAVWNFSGTNPWHLTALDGTLDTVQENACESCHRSHGGDINGRLLKQGGEEVMCLVCHGGLMTDGNVSDSADPTYNIQTSLSKPYRHPVAAYSGRHLPVRKTIGTSRGVVREDEDNLRDNRHSECPDCHNPHFGQEGVSPNAEASTADNTRSETYGAMEGVWGVTPSSWPSNWGNVLRSSYTEVDVVTQQYQICLKCHSDYAYDSMGVNSIPYSYASDFTGIEYQLTDQGKEFNPNNASYHRVTNVALPVGYNDFILPAPCTVDCDYSDSLLEGFTATSTMNCSDCHSDPLGMGVFPSGPKGPHGSEYEFILRANWDELTGQNGTSSDICFTCHDSTYYLSIGGLAITDWKKTGFSGPTDGVVVGTCDAGNSLPANLHILHSCERDTPCMTCHSAVPHGMNKKALLIYRRGTPDPAPYNAPAASPDRRFDYIPGDDYGIDSATNVDSISSGNWRWSDCHSAGSGVGDCS